jgi:hypothetical protein
VADYQGQVSARANDSFFRAGIPGAREPPVGLIDFKAAGGEFWRIVNQRRFSDLFRSPE